MARINAYAFDADGMASFMASLDQIHLVAIHRSKPDIRGRYFGTDTDAAVEWARGLNREHFGIYFTVNRVPDSFNDKPKKSDMVAARYVHCDIDPPRDQADFSMAATLETLDNLRCPPSFVIGSGNGLQPVWRLDGDCHNLDAIEGINQQVRTMFSADACFNIDRLFRVPGSVNWPSPTKEARGRKAAMATMAREDTGECYDPETLRAFFPPAEHGETAARARGAVAIGDVSLTTPTEIGMTPFCRARKAVERPSGSDRSHDVHHAACELVRAGYDDNVIAGLLLNPANAVSAHVLDQSDPMRSVRRAISAARGEEPDTLVVPDETRRAVASLSTGNGSKTDIVPKKGQEVCAPQDGGVPFWYPMLTPGLKLIVDTIMEYAPKPRLELALGAALATVATAAGRRYRSPTGVLTNMYLVGLLPSGGGKDFHLRSPGRILTLAQADETVGGRIVSAMGIRSGLEKYPVMFVPIDEMGKLLTAMNNPRGTLKDAVSMLLELYSEAQSFAKGGMYSNTKERQTVLIHNPCLTFFGASTPSTFWEGLTSQSISDGFLPRMILLMDNAPRTKTRMDLRVARWPDAVVDHVKAIRGGASGHITFPLGDGSLMEPKPYEVPYSDDSARMRWYEIVEQSEQAFDDKPDRLHPFYNRMTENATKMALVRAIDRDPQSPVLTAEDFEWGHLLSKRSIEAFEREIGENLSDSDYHAKLIRVRDVIAKAGSEGISTNEIGRAATSIAMKERRDILEDLEDQGVVVSEKVQTAGRPRYVYRMVSS